MKTKTLTVTAVLTAITIIIPMIMPLKVLIPPFTATLASHTPILLAMFISPLSAIVVSIGSAIGFLITLGPVVAARAATHVLFAAAGAYLIGKRKNMIIVAIVTLVLHSLSDMAIVFFISEFMGMADILKGNTMLYVQSVIGVGTSIHHIVDLAIAYAIYLPVAKATKNIFITY